MAATTVSADGSSLTFSADGASGTVLKNRAQTFSFGPEEFRIAKEGLFIPDVQLWSGGDLLASAKKRVFRYAGGLWKFECSSGWHQREYSLCQNNDRVGWIRLPIRWDRGLLVYFGKGPREEILIDLPDEFPAVVKLFLVWITFHLENEERDD